MVVTVELTVVMGRLNHLILLAQTTRACKTNTAFFSFAFLSENIEFATRPNGFKRVRFGCRSFEFHGYSVRVDLFLVFLLGIGVSIVSGGSDYFHH
ncbi:hypothetical protein HanRHA438_Chr06g0253761 [Helianthus annuus]|nr:hypothetical protein HanRHA438_Chr06g0253761 [Helianthus annuus]